MNESYYDVWVAPVVIILTGFTAILLASNVRLVNEIDVIQSDLDNLYSATGYCPEERPCVWGMTRVTYDPPLTLCTSDENGAMKCRREKQVDTNAFGATGVRQYKVVDTSYVTVQESDLPKEYRDSLKGK